MDLFFVFLQISHPRKLFWPAKLCQNAFQTIPKQKKLTQKIFRKLSYRKSTYSCRFRGATAEQTSKSTSPSNFASETPLLRSVRPKLMKNNIVATLTHPQKLSVGTSAQQQFHFSWFLVNRPQERCIQSKISRGSWFWGPFGRSFSKSETKTWFLTWNF